MKVTGYKKSGIVARFAILFSIIFLFILIISFFGWRIYAEATYYDSHGEDGSPASVEFYNDGELQVTSMIYGWVNGQSGDVTFEDKITIENLTEDKKITFNSVSAVLNEGFDSAVVGNWTVNNTDGEILFNGVVGDSFVPELDLDSGATKEFSVTTTLSGLDAGKIVNKKPFRFVYDYEAGTNEAYALLTSNNILKFYYDTNKDKREGTIFSIPEYIDGVDFENEEQPGWSTPAIARNINSIIFDGSFTEKYKPTTMSGWFRYMDNAGLIDLSGLDTSQVKSFWCCFNPEYEWSNSIFLFPEILVHEACINMGWMFSYCNIANYYKCISKFDVSSTIYMRGVFQFCFFNPLEALDLSQWNTSCVTTMCDLFLGCDNMQISPILKNWNTVKVTDMRCMFTGCTSLTNIDISSFTFTYNTEIGYYDSAGMFQDCINLEKIFCDKDWSTTIDPYKSCNMFCRCTKLPNYYLWTYDDYNGLAAKPSQLGGVFTDPNYSTLNYVVNIYGIGQDVVDGGAHMAGLTFGPAVGETVDCLHIDGHEEHGHSAGGHCICEDSWDEIVKNCNAGHADYYSDCLDYHCAKSVPLTLNSTIGTQPTTDVYCSTHSSTYINNTYRYWNSTYSESDNKSANYATSRIRSTLIGSDNMTPSIYAGDNLLTSSTCLLSCFPTNLANAIKPKYYQVPVTWQTSSSTTPAYKIDTSVYLNDKLWLMNAEEVYGTVGTNFTEWGKAQYKRNLDAGITTTAYSNNKVYTESSSTNYRWLRCSCRGGFYCAGNVSGGGSLNYNYVNSNYGLSACFCLGTNGSVEAEDIRRLEHSPLNEINGCRDIGSQQQSMMNKGNIGNSSFIENGQMDVIIDIDDYLIDDKKSKLESGESFVGIIGGDVLGVGVLAAADVFARRKRLRWRYVKAWVEIGELCAEYDSLNNHSEVIRTRKTDDFKIKK